jgi:hypothetical protein
MKILLPTAAALSMAILSACAMTSSEDAAPTPGVEREYITGSHIPRKSAPLTEEEKKARAAASQKAVQSMQATGAGIPKP